MKKIMVFVLIVSTIGCVDLSFALSRPKFELTPLTNTTVYINAEGNAQLKYRVTNNTKYSKTLTMKPMENVEQVTGDANYCGSTFTLAAGESCVLLLQISGSNLTDQMMIGGPVVCKTRSDGDPSPSLFQCTQPSQNSIITALKMPSQGKVKCWGFNQHGQLGDNNKPTDAHVPVSVLGIEDDVTAVTGGYFHSCALRSNGTVWCWGYNNSGQIGNGVVAAADVLTPSQVLGLDNVISIGGSYLHNCALKNDHSVWCWGNNSKGQLGNNSTTTSPIPVQVVNTDMGDIQEIAMGGTYHVCALNEAGKVWCWGYNNEGELGNALAGATSNIPLKVDNLENVIKLSAGSYHNCALKDDGSVWCWGANNKGQLGNPSFLGISTSVAQQVALDHVVSISTGYDSTCAKRYDGQVYCWGNNTYKQLGDNGASGAMSRTPVKVLNLENVIEVGTPFYHNCALTSDKSLWCWGDNTYGQLGINSTTVSGLPVKIDSAYGTFINIIRRATARYFSCAIVSA